MDNLRRDTVYAWRSLRRAKGLVATCVLSLALGLGAATVLFSVVDAALLRPPPFPDPDRLALVTITHRTPREGEYPERWSWRRFELLRASARSFESVASYSNAVLALDEGEGANSGAEALPLEVASAGYFHVAGFTPALGREFVRDDERLGTPPVAILGHDVWATRFHADSGIIGHFVRINGVAFAVIGVAPPGFAGISGRARLWINTAAAPLVSYADYLNTNQNFISVVGRVRSGASIDDARRELRVLGTRIQAEAPSDAEGTSDEFGATAVSLNYARADVTTRRALVLLSSAVVLLLLLACANVASLLLGRAESMTIARSCSWLRSASSEPIPFCDLSAGISCVSSHLPAA